MNIIQPSYQILTPISPNGYEELKMIEQAARVCYKSEANITKDGESAKLLIKMLIRSGHEAMLEHSTLTVKFICDRGISHEIVRHRMASFAQESTRYCNYSSNKFNNEITVIKPHFLITGSEAYKTWLDVMKKSEEAYFNLLDIGLVPQEARSVLPMSLKTEVVVTANFREWRHILKLRTAPDAHPQIRELMIPLAWELRSKIPVIFDDVLPEYDDEKGE